MGKFVPPIDQINKISPKKSRRSFSDLSKGSIFQEVKKVIKESYSADAFAQVGQMNAVVLEVIEEPAANMLWKSPLMSFLFEEQGKLPDYIEVRFRIPEIHAHLPEPKDQSDWAAINRHPKAMMKKEKGTPSPGDIVVIDFQDKNNFEGAVVVETLDTNLPVPAGGGQCSVPEIMNSANPFLGLSTPTGDQVVTDASVQSIKNNPAREAFEEGIKYPQSIETTGLFRLRYLVNINEFNTMEEFRNTSRTVEILGSKNVFSVCFTTSENDLYIRDISRLTKICSTLRDSDFKIGFRIIVENGFNFNQAYIKLYELIKTIPIDYVVYELRNQGNDLNSLEERKELILSIGDRFKIEVNYLITEKTILPSQYQFDSTKVALSDNHYDYAKIIVPEDTEFSKSVLPNEQKCRMYYMGGINFIKWAGELCLFGERIGKILKGELYSPTNSNDKVYLENYGFLKENIMDVIVEYSGKFYTESQKQSFLSSGRQIQTPKERNVENINAPTPTLSVLQISIEQPPEINSDSESSQDPQISPQPQSNLSPGLQCSPAGMGGQPMSTETGAASNVPAPPPSLRFDQFPGSENLGWTTDASKFVNNVIVDFMNRLSASIYRRVPYNSPAIAGSAFKKVRVTSTLRTAQTQVRLMWDKIDKLGENGVWSLYGKNSYWVKEVVEAYRENRNSQRAIGAVQANIDAGKSTGHLTGRGVDIHTWSHIKAEGLPHDGISKSQMMQSAYIRAVVDAAKECGGKPVVEAYQQHIHITIL
jgi:hypothetical protein